MIEARLSDIAAVLNARLVGDDVAFVGVSTDSRAVAAGSLFVALQGERFDAHEFAAEVLQHGAAAVLLERELPGVTPALVVADTRRALGQLAAWWRAKFAIPVIAITGSNGKTTVKEMTTSILRAAFGAERVHATAGNFNNDIGLPLTLFRLNARHACAVLEMGMNHPGELHYLSGLACPTVAVINNAQPAHLEGLGSVAAVAQAKGEIYAGLAADGVAVLNADDAFAPLWRELAGARPRLEFGLQHGDVRVHDGQTLHTPHGDFAIELAVPGEHNWRNAAAASSAALAVGVAPAAIQAGLAAFAGVKGRLQQKTTAAGAVVIDDSYNANPGSVAAAIGVLKAQTGRRILVLGDIGELGAQSLELHRGLGALAREAGIERLLTLGEHMRAAVAAFGEGAEACDSLESLLARLQPELASGVTVLVKGSRFMHMERVVEAITQ